MKSNMENGKLKYIFLSIEASVNRDNFDCGIPELNEYLQKYAKQNHRKGIATTFVAIPERENFNVVGYYSVCMSEIKRESLPENYHKQLPRYPIPAIKIAKLAVDKSSQGKGLGKKLLMECFRKAVSLSSEVGIFCVTVDALNQEAKNFYLKYGFIPFPDNTLSLFLPLKTLINIVK